MSRIRDIANILTSANVLSTDIETAAAITAAIDALPPGYGRGNTASRPASPTVGDIYVNTQTGFVEIYESTGWSQVGGIASTVTGVTATNVGTSRAFNNGSASVAFTPGTILGKTYAVTSSPGSYTASGSASPITITGLQSSTQYTYTVVASNNYGTASASSASSAVTATTVPQAPSITSVTGGNAQVSVAFSANATGGSSITGYTVTSSPGNLTATGSSSPLAVTGLTNGTAYTFTAVATNANGSSAASSASSSVTPVANVLADYLVVAGGGGGGSYGGGGGGGGTRSTVDATGGSGSLESALSLTVGTSYTVEVGGGGAGGTSSAAQSGSSRGGKGTNSLFSSITSTGGGSGSGFNDKTAINLEGGSGGGSVDSANSGLYIDGGVASPLGQGFNGGRGYRTNSGYNAGGGGGGSGSTGYDGGGTGTSPVKGAGGNSRNISITGSAISYAAGGSGMQEFGTDAVGAVGTINTGNGGNSSVGVGANRLAGGAGGSGVVIIRTLQAASSTAGSPTYTTSGSYHIYKFTGTGSITF